MAHFAQLDDNNVVINVIVVNDSDTTDDNGVETESVGIAFCQNLLGKDTNWKKTSYNTRAGKYYNADGTEGDQSKAFRKNFAAVGMIWDEDKDMFYSVKLYDSWTLNLTTGEWDPPTPYPDTETGGKKDSYEWNEETKSWDKVDGQIV